jgi:hypothetical protein
MLRLAVAANLSLFLICDAVLLAFAVVMFWLTTANGGPLKEHGSPMRPVDILAIVGFWGLVLLALSTLILAMVRSLQRSREANFGALG